MLRWRNAETLHRLAYLAEGMSTSAEASTADEEGTDAVDGDTDEWGLLLAKDSPLTDEVTAAVDALREDGTLDALVAEWLGADAGVAELK